MNFTNILGTISAVVGIAMSLMTDVLKCSVDAAGATTCAASWLTPAMGGYAIMFFSALLLLSKVIRPGGPLRGLFGTTAVVVPAAEAKTGVVTPAKVAAPGTGK